MYVKSKTLYPFLALHDSPFVCEKRILVHTGAAYCQYLDAILIAFFFFFFPTIDLFSLLHITKECKRLPPEVIGGYVDCLWTESCKFPVRNILTPCYLPELIRHLLLPHLPSWQQEMPVCLAFLVPSPPPLSLCKHQQVGLIVRKDVVPMPCCWHRSRDSCREDST